MLIARIWDAINDPMMGAIAERTRSKLGRFRPYIAFGCPFLAIFSVLTFTNHLTASLQQAFYGRVSFILLPVCCIHWSIFLTARWQVVMTEDADQRNKINTSRNIGMNLGMVIVNALSAVLMLRFFRTGLQRWQTDGAM